MPDFIVNSLPGVVIMLIGALIGAIAYRRNNTKQLREIQTQVITTYEAQAHIQEKEITRLRKENIAMRAAFKQLGIDIEIDGDEITLIRNETPKRTRIMQVHVEDEVKNGMTEKKEGA